MTKKFDYSLFIRWTGNEGAGTSSYESYSRAFDVSGKNKPILKGSADPVFLGDASLYNPEELLVAALSSCHMLSYLHLCAKARIVVVQYEDYATGIMLLDGGKGKFSEVTLNPHILIEDVKQTEQAKKLHEEAHHNCFIANSVNFPVNVQPKFV